jgi:hypothetical protein
MKTVCRFAILMSPTVLPKSSIHLMMIHLMVIHLMMMNSKKVLILEMLMTALRAPDKKLAAELPNRYADRGEDPDRLGHQDIDRID